MITKDEASEKYFNGIKTKHLRNFSTETPQGNIIEGFICKKPNRFLGSMLIQKVILKEKNVTFETEQFIQSMPKIHYYDNHHEMLQKGQTLYPVYEKLDGSCLILYGLYYKNELIEVVPKTRWLPVADSHIIDMFNEIDHSNIEAFFGAFSEANPTLLFELFGSLNQHSIFYPTVRIDIRLIGATDNGMFLDWFELDWLERQYDFIRPFKLFNLVYYNGSWKIRMMPGIFYYYLFVGCSQEHIDDMLLREYPTQYDAIQALKSMVTKINKNYIKSKNRSLLEGVVVDSYNKDSNLMYLKIKSADFEERCRIENGVPRKFVLKEVYKYFDEYGSRAKEIYQEDEGHVSEYVSRNLLEEFDLAAVEMKKTQSRIKNVFLDVLESKEPPKGLQDICQGLVDYNPDTDVTDLMRLFAQQYPEKKRYASLAYGIFVKLV